MNKIRTILMGTPEFAATIFRTFHGTSYRTSHEFNIVAVITAPDKPIGRKQGLIPSPVKKFALENKIPVLQPENIKEPLRIEKIKELKPDLIILTAYGQIIPKEVLDMPKYGALNIHPSLLPKYRGASPIQTTILNGDKETGVTILLMDEKMDHGDIIKNKKLKIKNKKLNYLELSKQLAGLGAELLIETIPQWVAGEIKPKPQDHSKATYTKILKKEDGKMDWQKSAEEIERMTRAFCPWPGTFASLKLKSKSQKLKVLKVETLPISTEKQPGEVFLTDDKKLAVQTGNGILIIKEIQPEGRKPMTAKEFLNGYPGIVGAKLE